MNIILLKMVLVDILNLVIRDYIQNGSSIPEIALKDIFIIFHGVQ